MDKLHKSVLSAMAAGIALAGSCFADLRISTADAMKQATAKPTPEYSAMARQMKISGRAEVEAVIAPDGSVESAKAISGNPLLTGPAVTAVKRWKFTPFTANGEAIRAVAVLSFEFKP